MGTDLDPIIGGWYSHLDKGKQFQIVAIDEDTRIVEIQHFGGDLDEVAQEEWYDMDIESIEPPEDWTGPVDNVERDDLGFTNEEMRPDDWTRPLGEFNVETESEEQLKKGERESGDDWGEGYPEEEQWQGEE